MRGTTETNGMKETPDIKDIKEREAALDPSRSFIVQAPAGSGKTTLLIQRFLRLIAVVKRPEEILAITFTRKAAGQMHGKIIEALHKAASGGEAENECEAATVALAAKALLADKEHGWNLLENPGRLRVMTIDSFSASLTRQTPLLSRLGMEPVVTERPRPLYEEAVRRTMAMMDDEERLAPSIMQLLRYNDNFSADLQNKLVEMLAKRDQWLRHIPGETDIDETSAREALEGALRRLIEDGLARAAEAFPRPLTETLAASARYAAVNVDKDNPIAGLRDLKGLPEANFKNLGLWKAIAVLLIPASKDTWRSPRGVNKKIGFPAEKTDEAVEAKDLFKSLLSSLQDNEELLAALNEVRRLPWPRYDEADWKTLRALLRLLPVARWHLLDVFAKEGILDFPAVSLAALKALGPDDMPTDLMLLIDNTFRHILVDEYQDTSWTQVSLVRALTKGWEPDDGKTLFIVGDPMQSIYRFRDADVGLFLRARYEGLGPLKLKYLRLKSNFRSEGHVVRWVNGTFGLVFPPVHDVTTGAVPYGEAIAVKGPGEEARVNIRLYRGRDDAREARDVLNIIANIKQGESVAVLARSRSHLKAIVAELKKAGIDFLAKDLDRLTDRPVTLDLLALLRALMNPVDRVAWLAVLRAGWCGLSLADMHGLCLGAEDAPLWELIHDADRLSRLTGEGRRRLLHFRESMAKAMKLRGRVGARSLLEGLWTALGGPALYSGDDAMREAGRFFDIVESIDMEGPAFTAEELEARIEGLYAAGSAETENPIHLMTIHGAKGLEFDHVILPGLGRQPRNREKEILYWMERDGDLILAPMEKKGAKSANLSYQYLKAIYSERERLEQTRLFYVAATRAAKELYLLGHVDAAADGISPGGRSFLKLISHVLTEDMVAGAEDGEGLKDETETPEVRLKRLAAPWRAPAPEPPCAFPEDPVRASEASDTRMPVFDWAGAGARRIGTVVHAYLQRIAAEGVPAWEGERVQGERPRMAAMLRGLGLNGSKAGEDAEECINIITKALSDPQGRWILGAHSEDASEYALTGVVDGRIRRVIIDRTFVDEKGVRWVIDYKTGRHRGGDLAGFLASEKERYMAQLEGYARVLDAGGDGKNIRKGLYYPAISAWIQW